VLLIVIVYLAFVAAASWFGPLLIATSLHNRSLRQPYLGGISTTGTIVRINTTHPFLDKYPVYVPIVEFRDLHGQEVTF